MQQNVKLDISIIKLMLNDFCIYFSKYIKCGLHFIIVRNSTCLVVKNNYSCDLMLVVTHEFVGDQTELFGGRLFCHIVFEHH